MYYLKTEGHFDAAHFLQGYQGKCHNLHGHRWRVVVRIQADELIETGQQREMVVDFGDLKKDVRALCATFDHTLIYEHGSLKETTVTALEDEDFSLCAVPFRPTAEAFARHFYQLLQAKGYQVDVVEIYETPDNCAIYGGK